MKQIKNKIIGIVKKIYKVKFSNIIYIFIFNILLFLIFNIVRHIIPNLLNIHLNLKIDIDYFTFYSYILSLILPLLIMLMDKISKKDYIIVETYIKDTMMFSILIYFCSNLVIMIFFSNYYDKYYLMFTLLISIILIIYMYYKSFKLLSDLRYEKEKIKDTRAEIIQNDLFDQINHFDTTNNINQYFKFGIKVEKYDFIDGSNYFKINIRPTHDLRKVEKYNYKIINKALKILMKVNKDYINNESLNDKINHKEYIAPNIVIVLLSIGSTIRKDRNCVTIYYKYEVEEDAKNLEKILSETIYITSENLNHFYIKTNYMYLQNDCVNAINTSSAVLLSNELNKYLDLYFDYIKGIKKVIGDYSYKEAYEHTHSLYMINAYDILELIRKDIIDFSHVILKQDNAYLMNELIRFLYDMILFSYSNEELLSIEYLDNLYIYLNFQSLKLSEKDISFEKIKLELFEFIGLCKYSINLDNMEFNKNVLLVYNKTISKILFDLSKDKDNEKYFLQYLKKVFNFIDKINDELKQIQYSENGNNLKMTGIYKEILINYNCNFFATLAYVIKNWNADNNRDISLILNEYSKYNVNELTNVLLQTIDKDHNDKTYSWDLLEEIDFDEEVAVYNVNTYSYLIHLYCLILNSRDSSKVIFPDNYRLSAHSNSLIKEFEQLNNLDLIVKVKDLVSKIEFQVKEYIIKEPISLEKVEQFKSDFVNNYYKNAKLYEILKKTDNLSIVKEKQQGKNYFGLSYLIDKKYFLSNNMIIGKNLNEDFAYMFIQAEEKKYAKHLDKNSIMNDLDILSYLDKNKINYNKTIIFADELAIYDILHYSNIAYEIPKKNNYKGLETSMYFVYKNNYVPIFSLSGLDKKTIYLFNVKDLGIMEKSIEDFEIEINDFRNNNELIEKFMSTNVKGLPLKGEERKNHLLESVNLCINEYVRFDDKKMKGEKFNK